MIVYHKLYTISSIGIKVITRTLYLFCDENRKTYGKSIIFTKIKVRLE